ncbi:hypothetical protein C8F01DRAFT_980512 [Mycena amicta]|nr:hypothetical protein C8F01DRAFT_980512 [Mycena amicta]
MDVDDQDEVDLPDPRKQMEAARRLSKYVFPRQYGLASPFRFESQSSMLPDFSNRDPHIAALGPCKTPKRLKDAVVMLEKVIWRHGKCRYWQLRNLACPSEVCPSLLRVIFSPLGVASPEEGFQERSPCAHCSLFSISDVFSQWRSQALLAHRTSSAPRSQKEYHLDPSYDTEGDTISAMGLTQAEEHARRKPRLAEMACSHANVRIVSFFPFPQTHFAS